MNGPRISPWHAFLLQRIGPELVESVGIWSRHRVLGKPYFAIPITTTVIRKGIQTMTRLMVVSPVFFARQDITTWDMGRLTFRERQRRSRKVARGERAQRATPGMPIYRECTPTGVLGIPHPVGVRIWVR